MGFFRELFKENSTTLRYYIPFGLMLISFFWKFYFIDHRDISMDEPFTIFNAQKSVSAVIEISLKGEPNPPLFMLILHYWISLFGLDAASVRFVPLIFNTLTIPFIYFTGIRFFSFWTGFTATGLFILSGYHFFHALEARTYSLLVLQTAASVYFLFHYLNDQKNKRALLGLIITNILMVYSHYFGWFIILAQLLSSSLYIRNWKSLFNLAKPLMGTLIGFLPMIWIIFRQYEKSSKGTWLEPARSIDYINQIYFFMNHRKVFFLFLILIALGILVTLISALKKKMINPVKGLFVLFIWWFVPYTIMFFLSSKIPMFAPRYILFNSIGLYLFFAALLSFTYQRKWLLEAVTGLLLLWTMYSELRVLPKDFYHREVRNAVEFARKHETGSTIFVIWPPWTDFQFNYYYDRSIFTNHEKYYEVMVNSGIFRVWGLPNTQQVVGRNPDKRVILLQDGVINDPKENIIGFLDSTYQRVDSAFFPQTIRVLVYDPKHNLE